MKFLFDLQHPAHFHFFRNLIVRLKDEGHLVLITARDKDILVQLTKESGMKLLIFGKAKKGVLRLSFELLYRQWRLFTLMCRFRPDAVMAIAGTYICIPAWLCRIPRYVFYDTEHANMSNLLAYPFATCIYVPQCYRKSISYRHRRYNGYHELAYLHPRYFKPDSQVLSKIGLRSDGLFIVVRFVGWGAVHDIGLAGFSTENKRRAVETLLRYGNVVISAEDPLPADLEPYRCTLPVSDMHHLLAHAALVFGESATMASEGAVLGVPGIYLDPVGRGYTDEQEKEFGLVFNFTGLQQLEAIDKAVEILSDYRREDWQARGVRLRDSKIDIGEMLYEIATTRPYA